MIEFAPENAARFPLAGDPVVITVPEPDGAEHAPSPLRNVVDEQVPLHSA